MLIAAMMLSSFSSVMAETFYPNIFVSNKAVVWIIPTDKDFDARDVLITSIVVECWFEKDGSTMHQYLYPYKVSLSRWQIKLYFDPYGQIDPMPEVAIKNAVSGLLSTGDDFYATGPGWTSSFRPR